jgi:phosphoribosylglycinamide formyltransferase-1
MLRLAFLASNNGSAMRAIVEAIATKQLNAEPRLVVSNKATAGAIAYAREAGIPSRVIPTLPDADEADRALFEALSASGVDLIILSGYLRKLGARTLAAFAGRILNTHPALLPEFGGKGMYGRRVHEAVLAAGKCTTGVTIHLVDDEYDHGEIVAQRIVPIPALATAETVEAVVMDAEKSLFVETLRKIECGDLKL